MYSGFRDSDPRIETLVKMASFAKSLSGLVDVSSLSIV